MIYEKFYSALKWNTLEVVLYQLALVLHNIALAKVLGGSFFGVIGTIFSIIFLLIPILGFGFDKALIANFSTITTNKNNLKEFFFYQLFIQICALGLAIPILIKLGNPLDIIFCRPQSCFEISSLIWTIAGLIIITEGLRRSLKIFVQLTFKSKYTSIVEITLLIAYLIIVWSFYFLNEALTLEQIFIPFLMTSATSLLPYIYICSKIYRATPSTAAALSWKQFLKSRYEGYLFQLSSAFFSGNMLVPLFAYKYGLPVAGYLKIFSYIGGTVISFSEKIFGITSSALFISLGDSKERRIAFKKIKDQFLFIIGLASTLMILIYFVSRHPIYSGAGILFLWALILENFNIVYEKYFLVQHKILGIFFINLISALIFFLLFWFNAFDLKVAVLAIIFIRAISFVIVAKKATYLK